MRGAARARERAKANRTFETPFLIELIISTAIRSRDIYISSIDNTIRKKRNQRDRKRKREGEKRKRKAAAVVMDDIITTKGGIFMEGSVRATGRATSWKTSEVKNAGESRRDPDDRPSIRLFVRMVRSFACRARCEVLRVSLLTRLRKLLAQVDT